MTDPKKRYKRAKNVGYAILIPMTFVAGPLVGFAAGYWFDLKFGWDPWGKVVFILLGFVASVRQVIDLIKRSTQ